MTGQEEAPGPAENAEPQLEPGPHLMLDDGTDPVITNGRRFRRQEARSGGKVGWMYRKCSCQFVAIDERIAFTNKRIEATNDRIDAVNRRIDQLLSARH